MALIKWDLAKLLGAGLMLGAGLLSACSEDAVPKTLQIEEVFRGAPPLARRERNHSMTEAPDGNMRVYAAQKGDVTDLMVMTRTGPNDWSAPVRLDVPKLETNTSPRFFADGVLYYSSDGPHPNRPGRKDLNIWRVTCENGVWGVPEVLPDAINTGSSEDGFAPLGAGKAVFSSTTLGGIGGYDLYFAEQVDGQWTRTAPFAHNTAMADSHPATSPDGTVLIWYGHMPRDTLYGAVDLFVSRYRNGEWSVPENFGPAINTAGIDYGPGISADGRKLFFSREGVLLQTDLKKALGGAGFVQTVP